jgi:hypothetical protein
MPVFPNVQVELQDVYRKSLPRNNNVTEQHFFDLWLVLESKSLFSQCFVL